MDTPQVTSPLPSFRQPIPDPPLATDPPADQEPVDLPQTPAGERAGLLGRLSLRGQKPDPSTPTRTSSAGSSPEISEKDAVALAAGLVGVIGLAAAWVVRMRHGRTMRLRRPSDADTEAIGEPLGRILWRHARQYWGWVGPDLADIIKAGTATGVYLNDGDLLQPAAVDAGIPANLQEER